MTMLASLATTLAWRPFLDPLNLHEYWWALLPPLALGISVAYKAIRVRDMSEYPRQVVVMTGQIVLAMIVLGAAVFLFLEYVVPAIVPVRV